MKTAHAPVPGPSQIRPESTDEKMKHLFLNLDQLGLLDVLIGLTSDSETVARLTTLLASDEMLALIVKFPETVKMLSRIDPGTFSAIFDLFSERDLQPGLSRLMQIIMEMDTRGIMELILGFLKDEEAFGYAVRVFSDDAFFTLILRLPKFIETLANIDPQTMNTFNQMVNALKKETRPVRGSLSLMRELKDEEVAAGIGRVLAVIRELGRSEK